MVNTEDGINTNLPDTVAILRSFAFREAVHDETPVGHPASLLVFFEHTRCHNKSIAKHHWEDERREDADAQDVTDERLAKHRPPYLQPQQYRYK